MNIGDPVGDMLTRIRNGQQAHKDSILSPASKLREGVLDVLKDEGYIRGWSRHEEREGVASLKIELKYSDGRPVIRSVQRVSKPGRRIYSKIKDLPRYYNGLGIKILSTSRGVMSDSKAREENVGGEVLAEVF